MTWNVAVGRWAAGALVAAALTVTPPAQADPDSAPAWSGQGRSFASTQRIDGTFANPLIGSDVPDVSTIKVSAEDAGEKRDVYYMISTTMELSPGAPVLKSYDLVNWEIASYVWGVLETNDHSALRNGASSYGRGQWASTIAFHKGTYYVIFNSNNNGHSYLFTTQDIEKGSWERHSYNTSFHDPSLYFEGDTPYVFYGAADTSVARLSPDLKTVEQRFAGVITPANFVNAQEGTFARSDFGSGWEGFQLYKVGDWYYAMAISWGRFGRQALVFRSKTLLGAAGGDPYEAQIAVGTKAIAQGGFVSTQADGVPDYALLFADDYPTGRIPVLVPTAFDDGDADAWPVFGAGLTSGDNSGQVVFPGDLPMPVTLPAAEQRLAMSKSVVSSDDFDNDEPYRDWNQPVPGEVEEPAREGELLVNGDVEAGTSSWAGLGAATLSLGYSTRHGGATSLKVNGRAAHTDGAYQSVDDLVPGAEYDVSAWVHYRDVGDPSTTFAVVLSDASGSSQVMAQGQVEKGSATAPTTFVRIAGTFTAPTTGLDLSTARVSIRTVGPGAVPDIFFVDDLSVFGERELPETWTPEEDADNGSRLALPWQWNHNPDNRHWSLTDREGWLRLTTGRVVTGKATTQFKLTKFEEARNTLSQRTFAPTSSAETRMDVAGMRDGDTAGLAVYNRQVSYIAVRAGADGARTLGVVNRPATTYAGSNPDIAGAEDFLVSVDLPAGASSVWVKADLDLRRSGATRNTVQFLYSLDGRTWEKLGAAQPKLAQWESSHFKGQRFGLFNYAEKTAGGSVDFDYYALSDALTSDGAPVRTDDLAWLVAEAKGLDPTDYTADQWAPVAAALADAQAVTEPSTQNQVDAVAQPLNAAVAALPAVEPDPEPAPTSVSVSPVSVVYGQVASLRVRVAGADEGVVSTVVGGRKVSARVDAAGRAVLALPRRSLAPGAHTLRVSYAGTADLAASSATVRVSVSRARAVVAVAVPSQVKAGRVLTVKARVSASAVSVTGRVTVALGGVRVSAVRRVLDDGMVTVSFRVPRRTAPGLKRVVVSYGGSAYVVPAKATRTFRVTR